MDLIHWFWWLISVIALGVIVLTVLGFLARIWWVFDLASHFRLQYLVVLLVSGVAFSFGKRWGMASYASIFALINFIILLRLYLRPRITSQQGQVYRLLQANVLQKNPSADQLTALIQGEKPDFILLVEPNQRWLDELETMLQDYPHWAAAPRSDNYGIALISRIPIVKHEMRTFSAQSNPSVVAEFLLNGSRLTIIGTHPPPPKSASMTALRDQQMEALARFTSQQEGEVLVCGDLNLTPWAPTFLRTLKIGQLKDSTRGFGLQPTWPVNNPLMRVPIDHCLVSPGLHVVRRAVGPAIGSDHFPLIVEFQI